MFQVDFSTLPERFRDKVYPNIFTGCWIWFAGQDKDSYGKFTYGLNRDKKTWRAHRFCWQFFHGPIPEGLELDHVVCKQPLCVNPAHLEIVTREENIRRGNCWKRLRERTHCSRGHSLADCYIEILKNGHYSRTCRICKCAQSRKDGKRYRARQHAM